MNDPISRAEALLQNSETVTLAANGADGYPHAYVMTKLPGGGGSAGSRSWQRTARTRSGTWSGTPGPA